VVGPASAGVGGVDAPVTPVDSDVARTAVGTDLPVVPQPARTKMAAATAARVPDTADRFVTMLRRCPTSIRFPDGPGPTRLRVPLHASA
jgi:hypothetical protein